MQAAFCKKSIEVKVLKLIHVGAVVIPYVLAVQVGSSGDGIYTS